MKAFVVALALLIAFGAGAPAWAKTDGELRIRYAGARCDSATARQSGDPACRTPRQRSRRPDACQSRDPFGASTRECDILRRGAAGAAVASRRGEPKGMMVGDVGFGSTTR